MMKAVNTIRIKKGHVDEVLVRFQTPKAVHTFDGFILMEVLKKENSPKYDELKICTTWEERQFFDNWLGSRASQKAYDKKAEQKPENNPIISSQLSTFEVSIQHQPAAQEV